MDDATPIHSGYSLFGKAAFTKKLIGVALLLFSFLNNIQAQSFQNQLGSWNILNIKVTVNNKCSMFLESQLRSLSFYNQFHYYEIKGGATYNLN